MPRHRPPRWLPRGAGTTRAGPRSGTRLPLGSPARPRCGGPCPVPTRSAVGGWAPRAVSLLRPDLEGQPRPGGIADVDDLAVMEVENRHAIAVEVRSVERTVVDRQPPALVEAQDQVRAGDARVRNAQVGVQITPNDHFIACGEGNVGPVVPDGQHGRGWSSYHFSSTHHFSIVCVSECALCDAAVSSLCFGLATHSFYIASNGPVPHILRHHSCGYVGPVPPSGQLRSPRTAQTCYEPAFGTRRCQASQ